MEEREGTGRKRRKENSDGKMGRVYGTIRTLTCGV